MLKPTPTIHHQDGRPCISLIINQKPVKSIIYQFLWIKSALIRVNLCPRRRGTNLLNSNLKICAVLPKDTESAKCFYFALSAITYLVIDITCT
jgi:hypothetical protein